MNKIDGVIFDLDGTLLDTTEGVIESVRFAARELGLPDLPTKDLKKFIGPPIQKSFLMFYGCEEKMALRGADLFRNYYKDKALLKAKPYEGILELCEILRKEKIKMAVATYKREDYALTLLKHFGFDKFCDSMHGADYHNILKKEDIVRLCQTEMECDGNKSVLVGDTLHDAVGAQKAETYFIGVTYGFGFKSDEDLNEVPHIGVADMPLEIKKCIDCFENVRNECN